MASKLYFCFTNYWASRWAQWTASR